MVTTQVTTGSEAVDDLDHNNLLVRAEEGYIGNVTRSEDDPDTSGKGVQRAGLYRSRTSGFSFDEEVSEVNDADIPGYVVTVNTPARQSTVAPNVPLDIGNVLNDPPVMITTSSGFYSNESNSTKVNLREIIQNPYEGEAETAILRAIESRIYDNDSLNILPEIPDKAQHLFEPNDAFSNEQNGTGNDIEAPMSRTQTVEDTSHFSFRSGQSGKSHLSTSKSTTTAYKRSGTLREMTEQLRNMQRTTPNLSNDEGYLARAAKNAQQTTSEVESNNNIQSGNRVTATVTFEMTSTAEHPPGFASTATSSLFQNAEKVYETYDTNNQMRRSILRNRIKSECSNPLPETNGENDREIALAPATNDCTIAKLSEDEPKKKLKTLKSRLKNSIQSIIDYSRRKWIFEVGMIAQVLRPDMEDVKRYIKYVLSLYIVVLLIAILLFYGCNNPIEEHSKASFSWWFLFLGIRQVLTFTLAKLCQYFFIDFLALKTRVVRKFLGPIITIGIVQAQGWPFLLSVWSAWNFLLLWGSRPFVNHWLYQQDVVDLFNNSNPSGTVLSSKIYSNILISCVISGLACAVKRVWIALFLGKKKVENYGLQAEKLMKRMILLSEVAHLGQEIRFASDQENTKQEGIKNTLARTHSNIRPWDFHNAYVKAKQPECYKNDEDEDDDEEEEEDQPAPQKTDSKTSLSNIVRERMKSVDSKVGKSNDTDAAKLPRTSSKGDLSVAAKSVHSTKSLSEQFRLGQLDKNKLHTLIGEWEEPYMKSELLKETTIADVLQFRTAVAFMDTEYPFSISFGPAQTRDQCVESASTVYSNLLLLTPDQTKLPFETLSLVALHQNGQLDDEKAKFLRKVLRPDRNGELTLLDFVKSCDKVYKNLRLFRAALHNSAQLDQAFHTIVNSVFILVLALIVLQVLSYNPLQVFLTFSGVLVSFAFMFGDAATSCFNGILFILVQRPYDIGDKISISSLTDITDSSGSPGWFVEGITLFSTTVRYGSTNEVATFANGSLAGCKIINCRRSPRACVYILLKFGVDVPYENIMLFKAATESFVAARPREWLSLITFEATRNEHDLAYIEYIIFLQHVEGWQTIGPILSSKADLSSFCNELSKKLGMRYEAPPLPVNLAFTDKKNGETIPNIFSKFPSSFDGNTQDVLKWTSSLSDTFIKAKMTKKQK